MGGHWVYNPAPRPILPHPNTCTLEEILELHSAPFYRKNRPCISPEEVEYWDNYLASERSIAKMDKEKEEAEYWVNYLASEKAIANMNISDEESIADLTTNSWPCID
eukprot:8284538-Heterocapsa_arctica.AAC.1